MTHPIAIGIMVVVFGLGLAVGYVIHISRGYDSALVREDDGGFLSSGQTRDGQLFGFVHSVERAKGDLELRFDPAERLTGEEAQLAALQAGRCAPERPEECAPQGYFIENNVVELFSYPLASDARVVMETRSTTASGAYVRGEAISLTEYENLFATSRDAAYWQRIPFWVTLERGRVRAIEEQYIP